MTEPSTKDTEQATEPEPRDFAAWLLETNKGRTHKELGREFAALVAAVQRLGKSGTLTLKVEVKPQTGRADMVITTETVTLKEPTGERPPSAFFVDSKTNSLVRDDPKQSSMFPNIR